MKKNKILKLFIAIALVISIQTLSIAASTGVVNVETVRVRKKATTDSDIVELVSIGDKITITGEEGNWYKVKVGKVTGYIRKDLLTVKGETTEIKPEENNTNEEGPTQTQVPNEGNSSEETPREDTPQEGGTQAGDSTMENPNGNPVETTGEVSKKNDTTISTITVTSTPFVGEKLQLNKETKIKIIPSANSSNIANLPSNTEVTVLEVINSWCRVETGEYAGWVRIDQ